MDRKPSGGSLLPFLYIPEGSFTDIQMYSFGASLAPNYYGYMTFFSLFMASVGELVQSCKVN